MGRKKILGLLLLLGLGCGSPQPSQNNNDQKSWEQKRLDSSLAYQILKGQKAKSEEVQNKLKIFLKDSAPPRIDNACKVLEERKTELYVEAKMVASNKNLILEDKQNILKALNSEITNIEDQLSMLDIAKNIK